MEVLHTKHPEAQTPTAASLDLYLVRPPELTPVGITENVEGGRRKTLGRGRTGGS